MKKNVSVLLLGLCILSWTSCDKSDSFSIIDPADKTLEITCGYDFHIPVSSTQWRIESVKTMPEEECLTDTNGQPMALEGHGRIEASNGWLALSRDKEDGFTIELKENFDAAAAREFVICLNDNGRRDYVKVSQMAAQGYRLVKTKFEEITEAREIYQSAEGCKSLTLSNETCEAVWRPYAYIFEDVVESSQFESDDYGAFDWMGKETISFPAPELFINDTIRWTKECVYKKGLTTLPYIRDIANGGKILLPPYANRYLKGEITYCKRICRYTFTIQNKDSGTQFEIKGLWTQIVPIMSHTLVTDAP